MKNLLIAGLLTIFGVTGFSQERGLSEDCKKQIGFMGLYAQQELYRDAADFWTKAIESCGTDKFVATEWSNARTIYTKLMKIDTSAQRQKELTDSLYWCYEEELKYIPSADIKAEYAAKLVKAQSKDRTKIDKLFAESIHELKSKLSINEMIMYFYHLIVKYNLADDGEPKEEARNFAIEEYLKLSDYIAAAQKLFADKGDTKAVKVYKKAQGYLDNYFAQLAKDCEMLTEVLGKKTSALPTQKDEKLAKIQAFLNILQKRGCDDSDLYGQLADSSIALNPSSEAYFAQGNFFTKKGDDAKARTYYEKAIELEGAEGENYGKYNYYLATSLATSKSHNAAFSTAKKVEGEFRGKAMLICANAVAARANSCGETTFDRKANYWLADDYMKKASALGETYSSRYASGAPSTNDIFEAGKAAGQSIRLSCWGESTTIR
ncbi:MAG: hypothetical protein AB8B74_06545 [Crocinitomicaceae bacterium]